MAGRILNNRSLEVRRVTNATENLRGMHLLYIAESEPAHIGNFLHKSPDQLLVVTEAPRGLDRGGVINFVLEDNRIRFDIEFGTAKRRGWRMSSRLLEVARSVCADSAPLSPAGQTGVVNDRK